MRALERRILALVVALPLTAPAAAWTADDKPKGAPAQAEPPADTPEDTKPEEPAAVTTNAAADPFAIESQNGEFRLVLGMVAQADGRPACARP